MNEQTRARHYLLAINTMVYVTLMKRMGVVSFPLHDIDLTGY